MSTYQFDFTVITDGDTEGDAMEEAMQLLADYRFAKESATVTVLDDEPHVPGDSPTQRVAALSADLRLLVESDDEYVDDAQTMMCAMDLLNAIDAMLAG